MLNVQTAPEAIASPPRAKRRYGDEFLNTVFGRLYEAAIDERKAARIYLAAADREREFYAPLAAYRWPLFKYVRKTRPRGTDSHQRHSRKVLQDIADTVYSRAIADAVANDERIAEQYRYDLAQRLRTCGTWMGFKECPDGHRQAHLSLCDLPKYCRRCARLKAHKTAQEIALGFGKLLERPRTGYWLRLLTVTVRNTGDTRADVKRLQRSFAKLWRSLYGGQASHAAAIRFVELGPENGTAHLHALMYAPFVAIQTISDRWHQFTGDSMVVDIRNVGQRHNGSWKVSQAEMMQAAMEVCKYATDFDKWVERHGLTDGTKRIAAAAHTLHGLHMRQRYGCALPAVFERRMGFKMPRPPKEETIHRCGCCGKLWASYIEVFEPRGPPILRVVKAT